jgi:GNAT superfamily N-acetyltransferase
MNEYSQPEISSKRNATTLLPLHLRSFQPGDGPAFRRLNEAWISKYFGMEEKDWVTLSDPVGEILERGGHILLATAGEMPIGCCALLRMGPGEFEVAKMAVEESYRGQGIGRKVLEYAIAHAQSLGARRLYLETNRKLANAIHLYESVGFRHLPPERVTPSPYARADVYMEMLL